MLIRFTASNVFSINNEIEFNMLAANNLREHNNHIYNHNNLTRNNFKILKSSIIYGPNASGKSNIIKAINFAKNLIIKGTVANTDIPIKLFKLDKKSISSPSSFEFEISINDKYYAYGFKINTKWILEEWLYEIGKNKEKQIYNRITKNENDISVKYDIDFKDKKENLFLEFVAKGTRPNQLFLTESINRNVIYFKEVYNWFNNVLTIILPATKFEDIRLNVPNESLSELYGKYFNFFDTGISSVKTENIEIEKALPELPNALKLDLLENLNKKYSSAIIRSILLDDKFTIVKDDNNNLKVRKLYTVHKATDTNEDIPFEFKEESDGTQRLYDLFPIFIDNIKESKVFIIDEINRSLHPHLTYNLFKLFLTLTENKKSQLIATTHELNLLDLKLFRRDEIWFVEKDKNGATQLYSLQDFKPRADKDIEKGYLLGRYGAIPIVHQIKDLGWLVKK